MIMMVPTNAYKKLYLYMATPTGADRYSLGALGEQLLWRYYYRYKKKAAYRPQQLSKQVPAKISILSVN